MYPLMGMTFRQFRNSIGATLREVAEATGTSEPTLSRFERDLHSPLGPLMLRLVDWAERERRQRRLPDSYRVDWAA